MAGSSASYHESLDKLSATTQDMHRAIVSLQEELEAVEVESTLDLFPT